MAKTNLDYARDLRDAADDFYKEILSKADEYQKTALKLSLLKGKYGVRPNEQQQRDIYNVSEDLQEIGAEIDADVAPFTQLIMPIIKELYAGNTSIVSRKLIDDTVQLIGYLNHASIENLDEISREISLSSSSILKQLETEQSRTPRAFAKKPTSGEIDLKQSESSISAIADILGLITKAEEAFRNKIGLMSRTRLNAFYKLESQRLDLLVAIIPDLKSVYQYLKSDNIDPSKLGEQVGEIVAVMQKAENLPYMDLPIFMNTGVGKLFNFVWLTRYIDQIQKHLSSARYQSLIVDIQTVIECIEYIQKTGISEANKITDFYLQQIIAENQNNIEYFEKEIDNYFSNNTAMVQAMPKSLYDEVNQVKNSPAVAGKDEDKIWSDYKLWYDKLEESIRDLIDFAKMYHNIKSLYPFTIALRAVDKNGKDVDNQAYVRSMQTLLNEALDGPKPMPTSKKALVAKLFNYYPADERIARAYYRVFGVENV